MGRLLTIVVVLLTTVVCGAVGTALYQAHFLPMSNVQRKRKEA